VVSFWPATWVNIKDYMIRISYKQFARISGRGNAWPVPIAQKLPAKKNPKKEPASFGFLFCHHWRAQRPEADLNLIC
jgi:hypothetical protein